MKAEATDALGSGTVEMEGTVAHLLAFCTDVLMTEKSVEVCSLTTLESVEKFFSLGSR